MDKYVIVAGNICTGKTSLCRGLKNKNPSFDLYSEKRELFLEEFYSNSEMYAFLNQLSYSIQYLEYQSELEFGHRDIVQDRSIYDTHYVFSKLWFDKGAISIKEFSLLERIFKLGLGYRKPTILIYLVSKAEIIYGRINKRNYIEEKIISIEYIELLSKYYDDWFDEYEICEKVRIDTSNLSMEEVLSLVLKVIK